MQKRTKVWTRLGYAALAGGASTLLLAGCGGESGEGEGKKKAPAQETGTVAPGSGTANGANGTDEGVHQGHAASATGSGEGEGAPADADLRTDNAAYLTQLSLVRGHLLVGMGLYRQGAIDASSGHFSHPEIEIYPQLVPVLVARGAKPFKAELDALAAAVAEAAPKGEIEAAYGRVLAAIDAAEHANTGTALSEPKSVLALIEKIVRVAGTEYGNAVRDGRVVLPVEYQDAFGFTEVAKARLQAISGKDQSASVKAVVAQVSKQLAGLDAAWPGRKLIPPEKVSATGALFHGAAARIEIAALAL
ncbi:MAG: hypothetical protein U1E87_07720 [Alphaproteobacteria bacterium]